MLSLQASNCTGYPRTIPVCAVFNTCFQTWDPCRSALLAIDKCILPGRYCSDQAVVVRSRAHGR